MTFSEALEELKQGKFITRVAYHGTIFLYLQRTREEAHPAVPETKVLTQPAIMVKGHHGVIASFCPKDEDLLADDWAVVNT